MNTRTIRFLWERRSARIILPILFAWLFTHSEAAIGQLLLQATTTKESNVTATSATLNGVVNPNSVLLSTTVEFEYGATTSYGNTVTARQSPLPSGLNSVAVSAEIRGLLPNTTYHYRVVARQTLGSKQGADVTFTTDTPTQDFWIAVNTNLTNFDVRALAVNSTSGDVFAGTFGGGVFRSTNNGGSWTVDTTAFRDHRVFSLAINSSGHVFAGAFDGSVFRSTSNGTNWEKVANLGGSKVLALTINATNGFIFAGTSNGIYRSTSNGNNWTEISTGLTNRDVRTLAINPSGHLFAGTDRGGSVFRSTNNGNTWAPVNGANGELTGRSIRTLAINKSGTIFVGTDAGIYRSEDNGNTWTPINAGLTTLGINALAINAVGTIFAGVGTFGSGVFRSTDNGDNWTAVNTGLTNLNLQALAVTPSGFLFAGTAGGGAFRTQESTAPGPVLLSISPVSGNRLQTLDVVFTGTNIIGNSPSVIVGDGITVNSVTEGVLDLTANLTIRTDAATGPREFRVKTEGLLGGTSNQKIFTVNNPPPTLGNITPASGNRLQTMDVVFTGTNFISGVTSVNVGNDVTVNSTIVDNSTSLRANLTIAAAAVTGPHEFWVTNIGPGGGTSSRIVFTVNNPRPTLASILPNSGNRLQTLDVSFTGTNFISGVTSVNVGSGITINSTNVNSSTSLTANLTISASAATGVQNFSVTNSGPGGGASENRTFTVNNPAPTLASISPISGKIGQTLSVVFAGTNFIDGVSSVNFGSNITINSIEVNPANGGTIQLTANITIGSNATTGARNVSVINASPGGGTATLTNGFTIGDQVPTLTSIFPTSGNRLQTLDVVFTGTNFISGVTSVNVGAGITVNSTTVTNSTSLTANITITTAAATGARNFSVTNSGPGGGDSGNQTFIVNNPAPTLTSIAPTSGNRLQTLDVVFTGTNFISGVTSVNVGTGITVNSITVTNSTSLIANLTITAAAATDAKNFSVTNSGPNGGTSESRAFTVNNPKPTLASIDPKGGGRSQTLEVVFTGTKFFNDASSVNVGPGIRVTSPPVISGSTSLKVILTIAADAVSGERNFSVTNSGPGGGTSNSLPFTVTGNNAPSIMHTPSSPWQSGKEIPVQAGVVDDDTVGIGATLHYRRGGEIGFTTVVMTSSSGNLFEGIIPASAVTSRGVEYFITATDGALTTWLPFSGIFSIQIQVDNEARPAAQPNGSAQNAYRLISVPLELDNKSPAAVLEDDLGKYDDTKWRFSELLADQTYKEFPNTSPMAPGRAFWLIVTAAGKVIDTGAGISNRTDVKYPVALHSQWNFIGNPFNFTIPVGNLRLKSNGQSPDLYFYNGTWNDPESAPVTAMQPFEGYAVYSDSDDTLFIDPDLSSGATSNQAGHETLWSIRILAQSRQARDVNNVAAVTPAASRAWDRMDHPEPPVIGEYVSVYFPHRDWTPSGPGYCTDARPEFSRGEIWEFEVATNIHDKVNLTFEGVEQVPEEFEVWIMDEALQLSQNLRERNRHAVAGAGADHPKQLKLVVGRAEFVEERLAGIKVIPASYELSQNFPNPFNPATTIRYGLPKAERVRVTIYNLLGEEVVTLVEDELKEAGYHAAIWDGRNQNRQQVASGIYFYRLRAGSFVMTKKMVFVQ